MPVARRRPRLTGVLVAAAIALVARASLADHYVVPTGSMEPTVAVGDHVVVDKLAYGVRLPFVDRYAIHFDGPRRGDVIVLDSPEDGHVLLKRVVGVPGDRVRVTDGHVEVDGVTASVSYDGAREVERLGDVVHPVATDGGGGPDMAAISVPADAYLVLGDNRGNSHDSRSFGFVRRDSVLGRVEATIVRAGHARWISLR